MDSNARGIKTIIDLMVVQCAVGKFCFFECGRPAGLAQKNEDLFKQAGVDFGIRWL